MLIEEAKLALFQPLTGTEIVAVPKRAPGEPELSEYSPTSTPAALLVASRYRAAESAVPDALAVNGQAWACWAFKPSAVVSMV
jgi:hypothetical protein